MRTAATLLSNLYSLWGILFRGWSVASLFFWFACEFLLVGVSTFILGRAWRGVGRELPKKIRELGSPSFLLVFLGVLFYASIFTAIALKGEIGSRDRLPDFLRDKVPGLAGNLLMFAASLALTLRKPDRGLGEADAVASEFLRKCGIVLGLYAVLMFHHHWSGARSIDTTSGYVVAMGALLIVLKAAADLGIVDRLFRRR